MSRRARSRELAVQLKRGDAYGPIERDEDDGDGNAPDVWALLEQQRQQSERAAPQHNQSEAP